MTQELLQMFLSGLLGLLTSGGIGGFMYMKQSKKLKELEVRAAEIQNESSTNSEWEKICEKKDNDIIRLESKIQTLEDNLKEKDEKIETLNKSRENAWEETSQTKIQSAQKDRIISEINWYRCEVNGCPYRKPPHKYGTFDFPKDANVEEIPIEN